MKMTKRIRKTLLILFAAMTMMLVTAGAAQAAPSAATKKVYKAYSSFLAKKGYKNQINTCYPDMIDFQVGYINGDNVPDLVVIYYAGPRGYANSLIYTYKNGKVTLMAKNGSDFIGYYVKKNTIKISSRYDGSGTMYETYKTPTKGYSASAGSLSRVTGYRKATTYAKTISGGRSQKISKKTFDSLLKKKVGNAKFVRVKAVRNNAANRKRVLGY